MSSLTTKIDAFNGIISKNLSYVNVVSENVVLIIRMNDSITPPARVLFQRFQMENVDGNAIQQHLGRDNCEQQTKERFHRHHATFSDESN